MPVAMLAPSLQQEIERWWHKLIATDDPNRQVEHNDYVQFCHRLSTAIQQHSSNLSNEHFTHEDVVKMMQKSHEVNENIEKNMFTQVLYELSMAWVKTYTNAQTEPEQEATILLQGLYANMFDTPISESKNASSPTMTMAQKLAQARNLRASLTTSTTTVTTINCNSINSTASMGPNSLDFDNSASHYFTVETRLELKERLQKLQLRIHPLLIQTKLAWMQCYRPNHQHHSDNAALLVKKGEELTSHLLDAFKHAQRNTGRINEYKAIVQCVEVELESFEKLLQDLLHRTKDEQLPSEGSEADEEQVDEIAPVIQFDLPSMAAYYAKAAPSYASYLTVNNNSKVTKSILRRKTKQRAQSVKRGTHPC